VTGVAPPGRREEVIIKLIRIVQAKERKKAGKKLWARFCPHYTPKHASWLNQAEIEIGMFSRGCIGKQRVATSSLLRKQARAWEKRMNRNKIKIDWTFSRRKARSKFRYKPARTKWSRH
jgi:hypothetical protein